ncbi:unnamed protein product [Phytophthora lilii]|uniref:Unnamed protein product n=1 Tax=Phytophthora lilii TaxID=2077276 RepID=A0A9W6U523_9STRA|nr:unnamed protein product [Phytophthora lilii]
MNSGRVDKIGVEFCLWDLTFETEWYVSAGTSYDKYPTTYLGGCKCANKSRCVCGKGLFPYEYISSFDVLSQTTIPPKSAFDSKLHGTSITSDDKTYQSIRWLED